MENSSRRSSWDWTYWTNPEAEGALWSAVTVIDESHWLCNTALLLPVGSHLQYSGWEMPLSLGAECLSHVKCDLQGEEKCLSGIDNQWCRFPQMKMQLITFLPFRAYTDPVLLFLFLRGKCQKCCLSEHQCHLFWSVGQHQPFGSSESKHKSAEFCLAFCCHK